MIDCLFIGYNNMKMENYKSAIKAFEALRLNKFFKWAPMNSNLYMLYKIINTSWFKYNNTPYSGFELYEKFHSNRLRESSILSTAISYLSTFIERRGFSFDYVNSFTDERETLAEKLKKNDFMAIAISTTFIVEDKPVQEIIKFIRKYNNTAKIIIGGPYILKQGENRKKRDYSSFLKHLNADFFIVNSQGEGALVELLSAIKNKSGFEGIKNIVYKVGDNYVSNPTESENNKLEDNTVDWSLFSDKLSELSIISTSRSCPFECAFCDFHVIGGNYQTSSPEAIEKELNTLKSTGKVKYLFFTDDTFNIPPAKFKSTLKMMIKNNYNFKWTSFIRCQYLDDETLQLMKESGCEGALLGLESANQSVLDKMNKKATVEGYKKGLDLLNKYDIESCASFIIGFPGETRETANDTVRFIEECKPTYYRLNLWMCIPYSPVYNRRKEYNIKGEGLLWSHSTMDAKTASSIIQDAYLSIKNSIYLPVFDFDTLSLFNQGIRPEQIREFLKLFNVAVRERLTNPKSKGISKELWDEIVKACSRTA